MRPAGRAFVSSAVFCALVCAPALAEKNVIVARTSPDVVLVWKVNDELTADRQKHLAGDALERAVLVRAVGIMMRALPAEASARSNVVLKLVYFNDGGFDPNYKIETVSGVRRVGEISAAADDVRRAGTAWRVNIEKGTTPPTLHAAFAADAFTLLQP